MKSRPFAKPCLKATPMQSSTWVLEQCPRHPFLLRVVWEATSSVIMAATEEFWSLTSFRNNFSTSPVEIQDLPHDYSRSPLQNLPTIDDSAFIAYLWAIIIHVISSASMTFASAAAGGPGSTSTPIVAIGLLLNLGHAVIGLMKGQGAHACSAGTEAHAWAAGQPSPAPLLSHHLQGWRPWLLHC